jgi:hypothetical protein
LLIQFAYETMTAAAAGADFLCSRPRTGKHPQNPPGKVPFSPRVSASDKIVNIVSHAHDLYEMSKIQDFQRVTADPIDAHDIP